MPIGCYCWLTEEEIAAIDWTQFDPDAEMGYILEVDLEYPPHLHLAHNSLPLAPHKMDITEDTISPFSRECLQQTRGKTVHQSSKLVSTFLPRVKYAVHAANLALYLQLGMKLVKVHRVLSFEQSNFLGKYIDSCTRRRAEAKTAFRKNIHKSFSNCNYGKFIEDKRQHLEVEICTTKEHFERCVENPRFVSFKVISTSGIVAVFLKPRRILMDQAWAIGFTILERSKEMIFDHYYNIIRPALDNNCSVVFTDTDSLCLRVVAPLSKEQVLDRLEPVMDYSNYDKSHPRYDTSRANRPKYWKDELSGKTMAEFVGLSSKCYSYRVLDDSGAAAVTKNKCKGVTKVVRSRIPFDEYKKCVTGISKHVVGQCRIESKNHTIRVVSTEKRAISSFDDKRYVFNCNIHTAAYGSTLINASRGGPGTCPFCEYWSS
jgi:hypothetical protein